MRTAATPSPSSLFEISSYVRNSGVTLRMPWSECQWAERTTVSMADDLDEAHRRASDIPVAAALPMSWLELRVREGGIGGADTAGDRGALAGAARRAGPTRQVRRRYGGRGQESWRAESVTWSNAPHRAAARPAALPRSPARAAHPGPSPDPHAPSPAPIPKAGAPRAPRGRPTAAAVSGARRRPGRRRCRRPVVRDRGRGPTPGTPPLPRRRPTGEEAGFLGCTIPAQPTSEPARPGYLCVF
ncbi:hypothetical protein QFZ55_000181 [Streptomyces luteogriseus]|nr:hypothetical protein [Streptomyces luteogriseus]